jgi:hypothetical protein
MEGLSEMEKGKEIYLVLHVLLRVSAYICHIAHNLFSLTKSYAYFPGTARASLGLRRP